MIDWHVIVELVREAVTLTTNEAAVLGLHLLWVALLVIPLKGIDRESFITALVYVLAHLITACVLLIAAPEFFGETRNFKTSVVILLICGGLATARFTYVNMRSKQAANIKAKVQASKEEGFTINTDGIADQVRRQETPDSEAAA